MRHGALAALAALAVMAGTAAAEVRAFEREADVEGRKGEMQKQKQLVIENADARVVVVPDPGGSIVEFTNLATGTNFVAGTVAKGRTGFGWIDYLRLRAFDPIEEITYNQPYHAEFREGQGWRSIYVRLEKDYLRIEREMRLGEKGREMAVSIRYTNISRQKQRMFMRWHPYSCVGDPYALGSVILAPESPDVIRKIFVGSGWDHNFQVRDDGYWMAVNWRSGEGLFGTFRKEQVPLNITWTDYKHAGRHALRGAFTFEPYPPPFLAEPGQSFEWQFSYYPFSRADKDEDIPLGALTDKDEMERARVFLRRVRPNIAEFATYTMSPIHWEVARTNRFDFNHRRRDRMAIRDWGIMDAMFAVNSLQKTPIRARYYAQLFNSWEKPVAVSFQIVIRNDSGKVVKTHRGINYTLTPGFFPLLDMRDDVPVDDLPDGTYTITVEGSVQGEKQPIHRYELTRRLLQKERDALAEALPKTPPPAEPPFVKALRTVEPGKAEKGRCEVPIGLEEGGGIPRAGWPVRCGVPFPKGMVQAKSARIELFGPDGKAAAAESQTMATWDDGSLRWLLLDFLADCPAGQHVFYKLAATEGRPAASAPMAVDKGDSIEVDLGDGRKRAISKSPKERVLGLFGPDDLWWTDGKDARYAFRLEGEDAGVSIDENNALRCAIKAVGWYVNAQGRAVAKGDLRLHFFKGQPFSHLYHTVIFTGSPWKDQLGSYGVAFTGLGAADAVEIEGDGKAAASGQKALLFQRTADYFATGVKPAGEGRRASGTVRFLKQGRPVLAVALRDAWRMHPKKIEADAAGSVTFSYWPKESGVFSFLPREEGMIPSSSSVETCATGLSRTHEFIIEEAGPDPTPLERFEARYFEPVVAITPPRWLRRTWCALHLAPYDPESNPEIEDYLSREMDAYLRHVELFRYYGEWYYGGIPNFWKDDLYAWADYGRYAYILNEQDIVQTPWLLYLRSGDRKHLKFAMANTRHLMEVATINWHDVWPDAVGMSRRHHECIWLGGPDSGHSMVDPFLEYYFSCGYKPAWEAALRMGRTMAATKEGSWRYLSNPLAGCSRMYLETQDPFFKEHALRMWNDLCYPDRNEWFAMDHGRRAAMWHMQINPQAREIFREWMGDPEPDPKKSKAERLRAPRTQALMWIETGDAKDALPLLKMVEVKEKSTRTKDPVLDGIWSITQYVLADVAEKTYMGEALAAAKKAAPPQPEAAKPPAKK